MYQYINVKSYGAKGDGVSDDTLSIQRAIIASSGTGSPIYFPAGSFLVTSTITLYSNISILGDNAANPGSVILTNINDGTPVFDIPSGGGFQIQNLTIWSLTGNIVDCVGIRAGDIGTSTYATRFFLSNLRLHKLGVGLQINGFIGTAHRLFIDYCNVGLEIDTANGTYWDVHIENCVTHMVVHDGQDVTIKAVIESGLSTTSSGIVILDGSSITMLDPYFEFANTSGLISAISVGEGSGTVQNFRLQGGTLSTFTSSGVSPPIVIDKVNGGGIFDFYAWNESTVTTQAYKLTANTNDFTVSPNRSARGVILDDGLTSLPLVNYIEDSNLTYYDNRSLTNFFGTRTSYSRESSGSGNIKTGTEAIRIVATSTPNTFHRRAFYLPQNLVAEFAGATFTLGVWVYVPDIPNFQYPNPPLRPAISLNDGVSTYTTNTGLQGYHLMPGGWQYIDIRGTINVAATTLVLYVDVVGSAPGGGTSDGSEYLILDSVYLVKGYHSQGQVLRSAPKSTRNTPQIVAPGDTTPSCQLSDVLVFQNSSGVSVSNFDNGVEGEFLTTIVDSYTTIVNSASIKLDNSLNFAPPNGGTLRLLNYSGVWYEISRAVF